MFNLDLCDEEDGQAQVVDADDERTVRAAIAQPDNRLELTPLPNEHNAIIICSPRRNQNLWDEKVGRTRKNVGKRMMSKIV